MTIDEGWCSADPVGYTSHQWIDHEAAGPDWEICRNCQSERMVIGERIGE
jgi:hypothetical protein